MLASLAGLTGLRSLRLARNALTSEQLEAAPLPAPHLTKLVLAGNQLRALPAGVAALAGLVDLDLSTTMISALPAAGQYLGNEPLPCIAMLQRPCNLCTCCAARLRAPQTRNILPERAQSRSLRLCFDPQDQLNVTTDHHCSLMRHFSCASLVTGGRS